MRDHFGKIFFNKKKVEHIANEAPAGFIIKVINHDGFFTDIIKIVVMDNGFKITVYNIVANEEGRIEFCNPQLRAEVKSPEFGLDQHALIMTD